MKRLVAASILGAILVSIAPAVLGQPAVSEFTLFAPPEVTSVSVSPSGEWIVAVAVHDDTMGLLAQRRGWGGAEPVFGSKRAIIGVTWIGNDTLLVEHSSDGDIKHVALRFWIEDGVIRHDHLEIKDFGRLVSPLIDHDGIVLWYKRAYDDWVVYRAPITSFAFGQRSRPGWPKGERTRVASSDEFVERWIADRQGVVRAALAYVGGRNPTPVIRYRGSCTRFVNPSV